MKVVGSNPERGLRIVEPERVLREGEVDILARSNRGVCGRNDLVYLGIELKSHNLMRTLRFGHKTFGRKNRFNFRYDAQSLWTDTDHQVFFVVIGHGCAVFVIQFDLKVRVADLLALVF